MKAYIEQQKISDTLLENYMPYAMSVIVSRAIPEIDGFKPSHRKLLYTMYQMKLLKGQRTKSANVVGTTMKLNPHGDMAIYETMVRLTRGYDALLHPYVDSKGNFGKHSSRDMAFAASRYTEVKLTGISAELFKDIDKDAVDFVDNYDGQMKEPVLLPTTFPNLLVNANRGIAVGMASNIPSFNLKEVCETTMALLKDPNHSISETLLAPDFSSGGELLYDKSEIESIYRTGRGGVRLRGKCTYIEKEKRIEITEIPYTTTVEAIIDKTIDLVKNNKIKGIADVRDEMDLKGLRIAIDLKRGANADEIIQQLFRYTTLEDSFSCNFNILIDGRPRVMGVKEILTEWIRFRMACMKRQLAFERGKKADKLHLLQGLERILLDIDQAIRIIRETEEEAEVVPNLMQAFRIDELQANYVADIRLRQLNREYLINRTEEIFQLREAIEEIDKTLKSDRRLKSRISKELERIVKSYGTERRTALVEKVHAANNKVEEVIADYDVHVFVTEHGYIKKITPQSLRMASEQKLKDDDQIVQEFEARNVNEVMVFTNKHNVYKLQLNELPDTKASAMGSYLSSILEFDSGEYAIYTILPGKYQGFMLFAFESGKIAKVPMESYQTVNNRRKLVKAYSDRSSLVWLQQVNEDLDLVLYRDSGPEARAMVVNTELVNAKVTRNTVGVQVLRLNKQSRMTMVEKLEDSLLVGAEQYRKDRIPMAGDSIKGKRRSTKQMTMF